MISNLYWPVLINETYSLLEYAISEGKFTNWAKLAVWSIPTFAVFAAEMGAGSSAISFLRGIDQTDELLLMPSAFYKLGWITHEDDEIYPY